MTWSSNHVTLPLIYCLVKKLAAFAFHCTGFESICKFSFAAWKCFTPVLY